MRLNAKASITVRTGRPGPWRRTFAVLAALSFAAALLFAATAPAAVVTDRPLLFTLNGAGTTAGTFAKIWALEVDQASGVVYVVDYGRNVLDKFNLAGEARTFSECGGCGSSLSPGFAIKEFADVAVDNSPVNTGRIYLLSEAGRPLGAFSSAGSPLWQIPEFGGNISFPCGIAVDTEGHPWIGTFSHEVLEYASSGSPPARIGSLALNHQVCGLDVDASGNVYVANSSGAAGVDKYVGGIFSSTIDSAPSSGVTVDQSSATGHVFVLHSAGFNEYDSLGTRLDTSGADTIGNGGGIAYDHALDRVYVADNKRNEVEVFGPPVTGTAPNVEITPVSNITATGGTFNGTVNPAGVASTWHFEWKRLNQSWSEASSSPSEATAGDNATVPVSFVATGLTEGQTLEVRLVGVDTNKPLRSRSRAVQFTPGEPPPPLISLDPPSSITTESAHLTGTIDPYDVATTWRVQTSTDASCEEDFTDGSPQTIPAGQAGSVPVEWNLTGLVSNQHYCVQISATDAGGNAISEVKQFTTLSAPPEAVTGFAAPRTTTTARLNGYVNPRHSATVYWFEYGPADCSANPCASVPATQDASAGDGLAHLLVARELTGLREDTTYHFCLIARNSAGTTPCEDRSFTTRTEAEAREVDQPPGSCPNEEIRVNQRFAYLPQCRGIELVNNPDDGNQNVKVEVKDGSSGFSPDGERAVWNVNGGAPGGNSGANATFLAKRTGPSGSAPTGWESKSLVPPAAQQIHAEEGSYALMAATPALTSFLFLPGGGSTFAETLVRLDENQSQEALMKYESSQLGSDSDLTANGAHVLHIDQDAGAHHVSQDQLEDIGTPGHPEVVSYLPDETTPECGVRDEGEGFTGGGNSSGASGQWRPGYHRMAVTDASRVYFQVNPNGSCNTDLWWILERNREAKEGKGETLQVAPPDESNALIRATPDGRSVYFVSALALDPADTNTHVDVYRWDEETKKDTCLTCGMENEKGETITDANLSIENAGPKPVMVSDDLSHVYFEIQLEADPAGDRR